jgi:hypothetical protein
MTNTVLDAALAYARDGIPVFPCAQKKPLTGPGGFKNATTNEEQIRNWWRITPDAQIAAPAGAKSHLLSVDIDNQGAADFLRELEAKFGSLPLTREIQTSPGHKQLHFRQPEGITSRCHIAFRGVLGFDVKGDGGYVILPPSVHHESRKPYRVVVDAPLAEAPAWLLALVNEPQPASKNGNGAVGEKILKGKRNATLTSLAGTMRRRGMSEDGIAAALVVENQRCDPPLPEADVRSIAKSVCRYPPGTAAKVGPAERASEAVAEPLAVADMPETVLDGRLGEICERRLLIYGLPIAYAWPATLAAASVLVPHEPRKKIRSNLYVALVGALHSGKSKSGEFAREALGVFPPTLQDLNAGSGEGLFESLAEAKGETRLVNPDELSHLLEKSQIDRASLPALLNRAFYESNFELRVSKRKLLAFHSTLSVFGGIVDRNFQYLFDWTTTAGLYDRFLFGQCPAPCQFLYRPFEGGKESTTPKLFDVNPDVWEARNEWLKTTPEANPRVAEIVLRAAGICASFDGRELSAADLGPAKSLFEYQTRVRQVLRPNPGTNDDAVCAFAAHTLLVRYAGAWVFKRELYRKIHGERFGPGVFHRCLMNMRFNEEIEFQKIEDKDAIRLAP